MNTRAFSYKHHRFPPQIIARAVWLYFRFPLSLRLVEEMLLERGIVVSYETIRRWGQKFGPAYAGQLRRKKPSHRDIWHLDEVVISIGGRKHWLWRAVDQDGYVLDEIVQTRRNTKAATRLMIRLLRMQAAQRQPRAERPAITPRCHGAHRMGSLGSKPISGTTPKTSSLQVFDSLPHGGAFRCKLGRPVTFVCPVQVPGPLHLGMSRAGRVALRGELSNADTIT